MFNKKRIENLERKVYELDSIIDSFRRDFYILDDWDYGDCDKCTYQGERFIKPEDAKEYRMISYGFDGSRRVEILHTGEVTYKYNKPQIDEWEKECKEFERGQKQDGKDKQK